MSTLLSAKAQPPQILFETLSSVVGGSLHPRTFLIRLHGMDQTSDVRIRASMINAEEEGAGVIREAEERSRDRSWR
jgi:hypothetical protein